MDKLNLEDEEFPADFLMMDFTKDTLLPYPATESNPSSSEKYKSNSCNDLYKKKNYKNVESKVKQYIASLDQPKSSGKVLKKHTSMPTSSQIDDQPLSTMAILRLEKEFEDYKRKSESDKRTITELKEKLEVSIAIINEKNYENYALINKIENMRLEMDEKIRSMELTKSNFNPMEMLKKVYTPRKASLEDVVLNATRNTIGSNEVFEDASSNSNPNLRKRQIDFDKIVPEDGAANGEPAHQREQEEGTPESVAPTVKKKTTGKKVKKMLVKLICGGDNNVSYRELGDSKTK